MKRMKKVFAMLLALAMIMGLNLTTFAAPDTNPLTGNITVKGLNANDETTVKIYQIVSHDANNSTWSVASWASSKVDLTKDPVTFNWTDLKDLAASQTAMDTQVAAKGSTEVLFENLPIGAYLILATESVVTYNPMGAALYTYNKDTHLIEAPAQNVVAWAKYANNKVTKELTSADGNFVKRGETVTFDITATFPSYDKDAQNRTFTITDTPTGLDITNVVVKVAGNVVAKDVAYTLTKAADGKVTVSFLESYIGTNNDYAGNSVVVSVEATVTSEDGYTNTANASNATDASTVKGYTGDLVIVKNDTEGKLLTGAEFEVSHDNVKLSFVSKGVETVYAEDGETIVSQTDVYKLALSTETGTTTLVSTTGTIRIEGLEEGTYSIEETKAPTGYSINDNIESVVIVENSEANVTASRTVVDSKLSALPSTGGIGTAAFTIGGCAIMIAAAYFFFVNRKKES